MKKFAKDLEGYRFGSAFVPFEAAKDSKGMTTFVNAMKKKGTRPNELELAGWVDADLLVRDQGLGQELHPPVGGRQHQQDQGLHRERDHGPDRLDRRDTGDGKDDCTAALVAKNGKFVPILGQPGKPFRASRTRRRRT